MNWKANNSKISRVCNNPYTNALTTNAHVSVAVYVSRQPTCLVYVFRVAVRETYKSCGCYVVLYVYGCKGSANRAKCQTNCYLFVFPNVWSSESQHACMIGRVVTEVDVVKCSLLSRQSLKVTFFLHIPILFAIYLTDSYQFQGLKGLTFMLFYANSLIIQKLFVNLQPEITLRL